MIAFEACTKSEITLIESMLLENMLLENEFKMYSFEQVSVFVEILLDLKLFASNNVSKLPLNDVILHVAIEYVFNASTFIISASIPPIICRLLKAA